MAGYRPSRELRVSKPCDQRWEALPGNSRVRHCDVCGKDVLNSAAMTPAQIEELIAGAGPLPCMRLVRQDDGSLLTVTAMRAPGGFVRLAAAAMSATIALASAAAQTGETRRDAVFTGRVFDASGVPIAHSSVELRSQRGVLVTTETNAAGEFKLTSATGTYELEIAAPGFQKFAGVITGSAGGQNLPPITMQARSENLGVVVVETHDAELETEAAPLSLYIQPSAAPSGPATERKTTAARSSPTPQNAATTPARR